ncbi:MAG: T9SS type A sorting domain-containing protein [Chitinophagaceae bacterium]
MKKSLLLSAWLFFAIPQVYSQNTNFSTIQNLLGGGFTNHSPHPFDTLSASYTEVIPKIPDSLGTYLVRLLNIDNNIMQSNADGSVKRNLDGTLDLHWPAVLENSLTMCKQYHWIPRIVWGLNPPDPLVTFQGLPSGHLYGPNNWNIYNEYTNDMLKHVIEEWGFKEIEVEVGNEPTGLGHAATAWWMPDITFPPPSDTIMWQASLEPYSNLYKNIANTIKSYRDQHPAITIRVGGPASNFGTFLPSAFPWLQNFVSNMLAQNIPLDFASFHCYHKTRNQGTTVLNGINSLKSIIANAGSNAFVCQSEWGFSGGSGTDAAMNFDPVAGAFALDVIYTLEKANVKNDLFLSLVNDNDSSASLYYTHNPTIDSPNYWTASHAGIALQQLSRISKGIRHICDAGSSPDLRCFASETAPGKIDIMVWAFNWETAPSHSIWLPDSIAGIKDVILKVYGLNKVFISQPILQKSIMINGKPDSTSTLTVSISPDSTLSLSGLNLKKGDYALISIMMPHGLNISATAPLILCKDSTTTITVSATGGTAPYIGTGSFIVSAGTYIYTVKDSNGDSATTSLTINEPPALNASASSGVILCQGGSTTIIVSASGGTSPFTGTGNFPASAGTYSYRVTDINGCAATALVIVPDGAGTLPAQPANIIGATADATGLCGGGNFNYSISQVANATSYRWIPPRGCTISGANSDSSSIIVNAPTNFTPGILSVSAQNACGASLATTKSLIARPTAPTSIAGPISVNKGQRALFYSVVAMAGLKYIWTVPFGCKIVYGQNTSSIKVTWGFKSGIVTVKSVNNCGNSAAASLSVSVIGGLTIATRNDSSSQTQMMNTSKSAIQSAIKNRQLSSSNSHQKEIPFFNNQLSISGAISISDDVHEIKIYPNPVKNVLNIHGLNDSGSTTLCIINVYGQLIKQLITNGSSYYSCNVQSLSSGAYFLKIITAKKTVMLKFIKG